MERIEVQAALEAAVGEVLETMCFTIVLSSSEAATEEAGDGDRLTAMLHFEGSPSGEFALSVPVAVARAVGASFLGKELDEVPDSQAAEVVCELANMFCGSALSRLEAGTIFHLSHPEFAPASLSFEQLAQVRPPNASEREAPPSSVAAPGGPCAFEELAQVRPPNAAERVVTPASGAASGGPCAFEELAQVRPPNAAERVVPPASSGAAPEGPCASDGSEISRRFELEEGFFSVSMGFRQVA